MSQRVIVSVTNDLVTDQRVDKTCETLKNLGFDVLLIGRLLPDSLPIHRDYQTKRFRLLFRKKAFFYAEFNFRLFLYLLFHKANLLISNDIDTALANRWIQKIKKIPLIIDCHEYFTGVPELVGREKTIKTWKRIERKTLPKANEVITVNQSLANLFKDEYNINVHVVRNVPANHSFTNRTTKPIFDFKYIIYQGAVNVDRGLEEMIEAMQFIENHKLVIAGKGDILESLKNHTSSLEWKDKIVFLGAIKPNELKNYTQQAELGLSLEKDTCINYKYCLPNKLFDYIQAGIPVLTSDLPEMKIIVDQYQIGETILSHQPKDIADAIKKILSNKVQYDIYCNNCVEASKNLSWEYESKILETIFAKYLKH